MILKSKNVGYNFIRLEVLKGIIKAGYVNNIFSAQSNLKLTVFFKLKLN